MPIQDARFPAAQTGAAGSLRKKTTLPAGGTRIPAIWAGNEKLGTEALVAANVNGLAVMFSPTSDGGALGVHAWWGRTHFKDYVTTPEELEDVLEGLRDFKPSQPAPSPLRPSNGPVRR